MGTAKAVVKGFRHPERKLSAEKALHMMQVGQAWLVATVATNAHPEMQYTLVGITFWQPQSRRGPRFKGAFALETGMSPSR